MSVERKKMSLPKSRVARTWKGKDTRRRDRDSTQINPQHDLLARLRSGSSEPAMRCGWSSVANRVHAFSPLAICFVPVGQTLRSRQTPLEGYLPCVHKLVDLARALNTGRLKGVPAERTGFARGGFRSAQSLSHCGRKPLAGRESVIPGSSPPFVAPWRSWALFPAPFLRGRRVRQFRPPSSG
jgi:hypothetical protein